MTLPPPKTIDGSPVTYDKRTGQTNIMYRPRQRNSKECTSEEAQAIQNELDPGETQLMRMKRDITNYEMGVRLQRNVLGNVGGTERIVYGCIVSSPPGQTNEEWSEGCQAMHSEQKTILPPAKGLQNTGLRERREKQKALIRGN